MSLPGLVRFIVFGGVSMAASTGVASVSWVVAFVMMGVAGLCMERRLASWFARDVAFLTTLAMLASLPSEGSDMGVAITRASLFLLASLAFLRFGAHSSQGVGALGVVALLALGPGVFVAWRSFGWSVSGDNLLIALFGARGLLYDAPLMWAGLAGPITLRRQWPGLSRLTLAAIASGLLALSLSGNVGESMGIAGLTAGFLPFLAPGVARLFDAVKSITARRPALVLTAAGGLLVIWNLLFIEQYRRRLIPVDDTTSFAKVAANAAAIVSNSVGSPQAWPANWIFAWRFQTSAEKWDALAGRRLLGGPDATRVTIELGDEGSGDTAFLGEGFGLPRTCERGWCRDLYTAGRLLLPLDGPRLGSLLIKVRARGEGRLTLSLNGTQTTVTQMSDTLQDVVLAVEAQTVKRGINVLALSVSGADRATIDRVTLSRDLGSESAR